MFLSEKNFPSFSIHRQQEEFPQDTPARRKKTKDPEESHKITPKRRTVRKDSPNRQLCPLFGKIVVEEGGGGTQQSLNPKLQKPCNTTEKRTSQKPKQQHQNTQHKDLSKEDLLYTTSSTRSLFVSPAQPISHPLLRIWKRNVFVRVKSSPFSNASKRCCCLFQKS